MMMMWFDVEKGKGVIGGEERKGEGQLHLDGGLIRESLITGGRLKRRGQARKC